MNDLVGATSIVADQSLWHMYSLLLAPLLFEPGIVPTNSYPVTWTLLYVMASGLLGRI